MTPWHVSEDLAQRYASNAAPEPDAWSLEKHVESCGSCAVRVSAAVRRGAAGPVLADIRAAVLSAAAPDTSRVPLRAVAKPRPRLGLLARALWAAGPALRGAWLVALVVVAAGALALGYGAGFDGARPVLLALAPALPLAGVAVSYGPYADPLHEIIASTPGGGLRLLLTRTLAVLLVSLPLLTVAGALLPASGGAPGAAAWLVPGVVLTLAALTLGSYVGCRTSTAVFGAGWLLSVAVPGSAPVLGQGPLSTAALSDNLARALSGPAAQGCWALAGVLCAGLLVLRRASFDLPPLNRLGHP
jgi:hypothetical protein